MENAIPGSLSAPAAPHGASAEIELLRKRCDEVHRNFSDTLNSLPFAFVEFGLDLNATFANPYAMDLFGYRFEELAKGINIMTLVPPHERDRIRQNITKVIAGDFGNPKEYELQKRNGSLLWIRIYARPIMRNGALRGCFACLIDLTEQKNLQNQFAMSEERFQRIFQKSAVGMALFLRSGNLLEHNAAFSELVEINMREQRDQGVFACFPSLANHLELPQKSQPASIEVEYRRPSAESASGNELRFYELHVVPLHPDSRDSLYLLEIYDQTLLKLRQRKELDEAQSQLAIKRNETSKLRAELRVTSALEGFVTTDPAMKKMLGQLPDIAATRATVLIHGESGTGKELIARAIHDLSPQRNGPFIPINCAAIPENLLEAELFGYAAGAFTDAKKTTPGKLAMANGGTLFLDEIGDMSLNLQAKLLRVLQERTYYPLGTTKAQAADARIIAATNKNLQNLVAEGKFREDLFYRIKVVTFALPPLRERRSDIPLLCHHFLSKFSIEYQRNILSIHPVAMARLMEYDFPGNVRELSNLIEHAAIFCTGDTICIEHFPIDAFSADTRQEAPHGPGSPFSTLEDLEMKKIISAISDAKGNKSEAARRLGIHKTTLLRKLKQLKAGQDGPA